MALSASAVAGIAGAALAVGTLLATFLNSRNSNQGPPTFESKGQGPVGTNYDPNQHAPQPGPAPMQPPVNPAPYASMYPWGYNAYIASIANTPMTQPTYGYTAYYPYNGMCYAGYSSPQVYSYNFNNQYGTYGWENQSPLIRPSPMGAPPGFQQPQQCTYNFHGSYTREYPTGAVSFAPIPACYNDDGTWRGW